MSGSGSTDTQFGTWVHSHVPLSGAEHRVGTRRLLEVGGPRLVAVVGGLAAAAAFEPFSFGLSAPVAMVLLWLSVQGQSFRGACASGLCFGLAFMLPLLWWLEASIGLGAWIALGIAQAVIVMTAAVGLWMVRGITAAPIWGGLVWASVEIVRSNWPLGGMPWGQLGFSAVDTPWESLLPYAGTSSTGAVIAAVGFALAQIGTGLSFRTVAVLAVPISGTVLAISAPVQLPVVGSADIAVVQGGVPGDGTDLAAHHREVTRRLTQETLNLAESLRRSGRSVNFVVWPENATAVDPFLDSIARADVLRAVSAVGAPLLVGGIVDGPTARTAYNRGVLLLPDGSSPAQYTKGHPVPFGEYIPLRSIIGGWFARFDEIPRDMLPGNQEGPLDVEGLLVADAICFDVAYDDVLPVQVRRGARLVVVQTSNAMFTGTAQPAQQFQITRARALELGRTTVVSSINGVSGVIGSDGAVQHRAPSNERAAFIASVDLHSELTPAVLLQEQRNIAILAGAGVALSWAGMIAVRLRRQRRNGVHRPTC